MTDHQKIHPVSESLPKPTAPVLPPQEAPPELPTAPVVPHGAPQEVPPKPTTPLVPHGVFRSEKGDPERQQPKYLPKQPKKRKSCCKCCLCWACWLLLLLIIILGIVAAVIYFVFQPKLPKYSVDSLKITQLNLDNNMSLQASINVNITARNPNKRIGIFYENGSHLSLWYVGTKLCEGKLPKFFQGHKNTTLLNLTLTGQTENATNLLQSLQLDQQNGIIPLNLRVKVPVRIRLGRLKLMKWKFLLKCRLNVDNLSENNVVRIRDNKCKVRFRF